MSFVMLRSRLALETFNGMVSGYSVEKQGVATATPPKMPKPPKMSLPKLPKPKPEGYEKPGGSDPDRDPETGAYREGTKREWKSGWHIKLSDDWLPYNPDKDKVFVEGEGWKDTKEHADSLGVSLDKPSEKPKPSEKKPEEAEKKPDISSDINQIREDLEANKISMDQAKTSTGSVMHRMGNKFRELKEKAGDPESRKRLNSVAKRAQTAAEKRKQALTDDNKKLMTEAVKLLDDLAKELGEVVEETSPKKEKSEEREFIYKKADLSTAPWEGKIANIEKAMGTKTKNRAFVTGQGNLSGVFFDETEGGAKIAYKPEGFGDPPHTKRATLREGPTSADRESSAFALDRILGFGIVPPTFHRESNVSLEDKKSFSRETGKKVNLGTEKADGSAQLFVKGVSVMNSDKSMGELYSTMSDIGRFNVQKKAVFDYITGNTDGHSGNVMIDGDQVYAIDNGLAFPDKGDMGQFKSIPMRAVQGREGGKINKRIIEQLTKIDKELVKKSMEESGLVSEAESVLKRIDNVVKSGGDLSGEEFTPRR